MICDQFFQRGSDNPSIYTRYRNANGDVISQTRDDFKSFFWIDAERTPDWKINKMVEQYPGTTVMRDVRATGLDGRPLIKVECYTPKDMYNMRGFFGKTYEADIRFADKFVIDNYAEMPRWSPRKWWFDIECDTGDDNFSTIIAVVDSDLDTPVVFAWADERTNCPFSVGGNYTREVRGVKYELRLTDSEDAMHDSFVEFFLERDPDMLIAHGGMFFDFPQLWKRMKDPSVLSPVGKFRKPEGGHYQRRTGGTDYTAQPIVGRWCFDTSAPATSGTGFERVWKDSGNGQLASRKLNDIAEMLDIGSKLTEEIEDMDVHNGWYEYWSDYVDYCLLDAVLLRDIDLSQNVTDFFVEMVRLCGVTFESTANVTNFGRGLLMRRTSLKAPSRMKSERDDLQGAEVGLSFVRGRHEGVGIYDYKGLYPSLILGNNLSFETKRSGPGVGIKMMENGTYWDQTKKGLLPEVIEYLFDYRDECKAKARDGARSPEERAAWQTTEKAVKRVMASLYGMTAHAGYGWADADIATTITSEGRRAIHILSRHAERKGYPTLYGHTDSAFLKVPRDEADALADELTEAVQAETGNSKLFVELEEWMPYWLLVKKNRYVGKNEAGKMKVAGFAMKASTASKLSKRVQETAFNLICDGADENTVTKEMRAIVREIKDGEIQAREVCTTTRLGMDLDKYKTLSGASRAADYYNRHMSDDELYGAGDSVSWVYVSRVPADKPDTDIIAFKDESDLDGFVIDQATIIKKMVTAKLKSSYDTLEWDLDAASGVPIPKRYW